MQALVSRLAPARLVTFAEKLKKVTACPSAALTNRPHALLVSRHAAVLVRHCAITLRLRKPLQAAVGPCAWLTER